MHGGGGGLPGDLLHATQTNMGTSDSLVLLMVYEAITHILAFVFHATSRPEVAAFRFQTIILTYHADPSLTTLKSSISVA